MVTYKGFNGSLTVSKRPAAGFYWNTYTGSPEYAQQVSRSGDTRNTHPVSEWGYPKHDFEGTHNRFSIDAFLVRRLLQDKESLDDLQAVLTTLMGFQGGPFLEVVLGSNKMRRDLAGVHMKIIFDAMQAKKNR